MVNSLTYLYFSFLLVILNPNLIVACTSFCLGDENRLIYGKNFDWITGSGQIIINKSGVAKKAISKQQEGRNKPLSWVSKYGSASFNLFGREFPLGGMNQAGLVIESLTLDETQYPPDDSRPEIMVSQWIQYQLDNFSRVEEVIANDSFLRISDSQDSKLHFLICERSGKCGTFEFLEGTLVSHLNDSLPVKVLTNTSYSHSLEHWKKGVIPEADQYNSVERFISSAKMVKSYDAQRAVDPVDYAFAILKKAEHNSFKTQWSIVYDITNLTIYFRIYDNQKIRHFDLKSFDFSCKTPVKVFELGKNSSGNIAREFLDFSYETNRNHMRNTFRESYFSILPADILNKFSGYPNTTTCND